MTRSALTATALLVVGVIALFVAGLGLIGLLAGGVSTGISEPRASLFGLPAGAVVAIATSIAALLGVVCVVAYVRAARVRR